MSDATTRDIAQAITEGIAQALAGRWDVERAYVSASAPEWAEVYVHLHNGQRFYVSVAGDDTD